ncbi:fungal specific transcription factor domain-containing protein [Trichophyton violaceum]|nr:fungal specific transcription factor domain-containing protein [Trichophyton violaceum]
MAGRAERSKPMNLWRAIGQRPKQSTDSVDDEESDDESGDEGNNTGFLHENDNVRHAVIKKAWHHTFRVGAVSIRPATNPASLSSLLSVAVRIAQRIGIHSESMYSTWPPLEAEIRRRLWWSLVVFDNRICEMSDYGTTSLNPSWDCRIPLNMNDSGLQPKMKASPAIADYKPSEMIFVVWRCQLADFIRYSAFHLDFTNPCFNKVMAARSSHIEEARHLVALERTIEEKYLASCNSESPLHYMTIWTIRGYIAKYRLLQHYTLNAKKQPDPLHTIGIFYALRMLECNTNLMDSPRIKGYLWLVQFHFPFLAYIHLLQDLKRRPVENHTDTAWKAMTHNYMLRIAGSNQEEHSDFFLVFSRIVLQAREACENSAREKGKILITPDIVLDIKKKIIQITTNFLGNISTAQSNESNTFDENYDNNERLGFNLDSFEYSDLFQLNTIEELLKSN